MMKSTLPRLGYLIAYVFIICLLGTAIYLEYYQGVVPCPLCILQRMALGLLAIFFLFGIALSSYRAGRIGIGILGLLGSFLGMFIAGRQVWLQHLPPGKVTNCDVSLQYMMQILPWHEIAQKIFQGTSECASVGWKFLSLSLAEWSLLAFILLMVFSIIQLRRS